MDSARCQLPSPISWYAWPRNLREQMARVEVQSRFVHQLSPGLWPRLGVDPGARVLSGARWYAYDLRAGGRRARRRTEVELFSNTLESLEDQVDLARSLMAKNMLDRLVGQLTELGMHEVREMVPMMLRECEPEQFQQGSASHETRSRNSFSLFGIRPRMLSVIDDDKKGKALR